MSRPDESLFDHGVVIAQSEAAHGGWIDRKRFCVSVPGIYGPDDPMWTLMVSYRRRAEAEAFLAGMKAGWRRGLELTERRRALSEYVDRRRVAVGDSPAVDVHFRCAVCSHEWLRWFTENDLSDLDSRRSDGVWVSVTEICPECAGEHSTDLDVDVIRRRLETWKTLWPTVRNLRP